MNVLLLRPDPGNERFGLGPFFRVEPLGLEYIAAALRTRGHSPAIVDLRFRRVSSWVKRTRPRLVGISCMHALEYDRVLDRYYTGRAAEDAWRAASLEWQTPQTPPGHGNWGDELPVAYRWAYAYSVPGAPEDFVPQNQPPVSARAAAPA